MGASNASDAVTIGWDVGGAHLKAALVERGRVRDVIQVPCTLWLGIAAVDAAVAAVRARWPQAPVRHAVTMTGEMVDLFADRREGVDALVRHLAHVLGPDVRFFTEAGWLDADAAVAAWARVASANWLATAAWVARAAGDALLIDVGSTTTDIIPVVRGRVAAIGRTDAARLESGELVYQGVVRTPLCALAQRVPFGGSDTNVMNEWFATTADIYRLTRELDPAHDQHDTADHRGKDRAATCARLARMIGRDVRDAAEADWLALARTWREAQVRWIEHSVAAVLASSTLSLDAPVVAAGCGDFVAVEIADRLGRRSLPFDDLLQLAGVDTTVATWARVCAPSAAVALLAAAEHDTAANDDPRIARLACGS